MRVAAARLGVLYHLGIGHPKDVFYKVALEAVRILAARNSAGSRDSAGK